MRKVNLCKGDDTSAIRAEGKALPQELFLRHSALLEGEGKRKYGVRLSTDCALFE